MTEAISTPPPPRQPRTDQSGRASPGQATAIRDDVDGRVRALLKPAADLQLDH